MRLYEEFWSKGFSVEAYFELPCVVEGDNNRLHEVIINRNILPLPMVRVKFASDKSFRFENSENISVSDRCYKNDIFSVSPYQKITRKVDFVCTQRGVFLIDQIDVIAANIFGKAKTVLQMVAIVIVLLNGFPFTLLETPANSFGWGNLFADIFVYLATFVSLLSGIIYVWQNRHVFKGDK